MVCYKLLSIFILQKRARKPMFEAGGPLFESRRVKIVSIQKKGNRTHSRWQKMPAI